MKENNSLIFLSYSKNVAEKCGLTAAILLGHIAYWVSRNRDNSEMKKDGVYWMYQTVDKIMEYFPPLKERAIRNMITKLEKSGYIKVGFFSAPPHHNTQWFTLTDLGYEHTINCKKFDTISMVPKEQDSILTKRQDASCRNSRVNPAKRAGLYNDNKANKKKQNVPPNGGGSAQATALTTLLDPEPTIAEDSIGKLVNELLTSMMILSPKAGHADFAQRKTAEKLIKKFGIESCREHVFYAKQIRQLPYGPVVKNIYDLEQKWYELEDFVQRKINESNSGGSKIISCEY